MSKMLVAALLVLVGLAGCAEDSETAPPPQEDTGGVPADEVTGDDFEFPEGYPTFCATQAECTFWDDEFHQYVLYEMDTVTLDVLVIPPASPFATRDAETMALSVRAWADGIEELAEPWFADNFTMNTYLIGTDVPPPEAIADPEIIVVGVQYNPVLLLGIGLQDPFGLCLDRGGAVQSSEPHIHGDVFVMQEECAQGGYTCLALNTSFLTGDERTMYDLVSHEVGHCLGAGHVGDALDFSAKRAPIEDIMSYQNNPEQVHCVSAPDVRVLEGVYAPLVGREDQALRPGDFYHYHPGDWMAVECENPPGDLI